VSLWLLLMQIYLLVDVLVVSAGIASFVI